MTLLPTPSSSDVDLSTVFDTAVISGKNFHLVQPVEVSGPVLSGTYGVKALRDDLVLHASDAVDLYNLVTRVEQKPGLTIQVFLKGAVNATLGGRHVLDGGVAGEPMRLRQPRAVMMARTRAELFERKGLRGDHMRKVSVSMPIPWLERSGIDWAGGAQALKGFCQEHMARRCWSPSAQLVSMAERLIAATASREPMAALFLEAYALELVASVLSTYAGEQGRGPEAQVSPRDLRRMGRVEEYLRSVDQAVVPLEELAKAAGVSLSTLQRLFQAVHRMSAFEFLRQRNLERARIALDRDGVSVKEAAYVAGYSSAANFSTAFRKHYGRTPRQVGQ